MGVEVVVEQEVIMQVMEVHQGLHHPQPPLTLPSHSMEGTLPLLHRDTHRARPLMLHPQLTVPHHHNKVHNLFYLFFFLLFITFFFINE